MPNDLWQFAPYITKSAIEGVIHHYESFDTRNPMAPISNGNFTIPSGHQGITSSRGFIKAQGQVSISDTNDAIKQSFTILNHSIPPREYWKFILKGYSRGSSKAICQGSVLHQSTLATKFLQYSLVSSRPVFHSIQSRFIKTCISFNPVHFPIWQGTHFIMQSNTASMIQYGPAVSLKE
ncbi:hypothetical protein O181_040119 [Austropuccinia psidii MF-1]|uniref:Uncharacterized protein n=1 Tax=Austropuccinia psidii MF-1 TaxID=1389203 RepID=A0A9Q3DBM0_9BASI|nr:hypothetical protein [Austropuccinia psidii MF-1]